jgi:hypothetical protein
MPTIDELKNDAPVGETFPEAVTDEESFVPEQPSRFNELLKKLLTAETGEGSIDSYLQHPMNFNNSKSMGRILRGLTGIIGNLSLAIIDIGLGVLEFSKENKGVVKENEPIGPNGSFYPS